MVLASPAAQRERVRCSVGSRSRLLPWDAAQQQRSSNAAATRRALRQACDGASACSTPSLKPHLILFAMPPKIRREATDLPAAYAIMRWREAVEVRGS